MIRAMVMIVLLTLTGCARPPDSSPTGNATASGSPMSANPPPPDHAGANPAQNMIVDMTLSARNRMFERFMRSGGERCARVSRSFYQGGTQAGEVFWNVACTDSGDWQVMIEPNSTGSTRIIECGVVATITPRARCWHRFDS